MPFAPSPLSETQVERTASFTKPNSSILLSRRVSCFQVIVGAVLDGRYGNGGEPESQKAL